MIRQNKKQQFKTKKKRVRVRVGGGGGGWIGCKFIVFIVC